MVDLLIGQAGKGRPRRSSAGMRYRPRFHQSIRIPSMLHVLELGIVDVAIRSRADAGAIDDPSVEDR